MSDEPNTLGGDEANAAIASLSQVDREIAKAKATLRYWEALKRAQGKLDAIVKSKPEAKS